MRVEEKNHLFITTSQYIAIMKVHRHLYREMSFRDILRDILVSVWGLGILGWEIRQVHFISPFLWIARCVLGRVVIDEMDVFDVFIELGDVFLEGCCVSWTWHFGS